MTHSSIRYSPSLSKPSLSDSMDSSFNSQNSENESPIAPVVAPSFLRASMKATRNNTSLNNVIAPDSCQALRARIDAYRNNFENSSMKLDKADKNEKRDSSDRSAAVADGNIKDDKLDQWHSRERIEKNDKGKYQLTNVQKLVMNDISNRIKERQRDLEPRKHFGHPTGHTLSLESAHCEMDTPVQNPSNSKGEGLTDVVPSASVVPPTSPNSKLTLNPILSPNVDASIVEKSFKQDIQPPTDGQTIEALKVINSVLRKQLNEKNARVHVLERMLSTQDEKVSAFEDFQNIERKNNEWLDIIQHLQNKLTLCSAENILKQARDTQKPQVVIEGNLLFELSNDMLNALIKETEEVIEKLNKDQTVTTSKHMAIMTLQKIVDEAQLRQTMNTLSARYVDIMHEKDLALRAGLNVNIQQTNKNTLILKRRWRSFGRKKRH